jgi:hypothetical protein
MERINKNPLLPWAFSGNFTTILQDARSNYQGKKDMLLGGRVKILYVFLGLHIYLFDNLMEIYIVLYVR